VEAWLHCVHAVWCDAILDVTVRELQRWQVLRLQYRLRLSLEL